MRPVGKASFAAMAGVFIALATTLPARATIVTQTLTGTLLNGNDNVGVFGAPNSDLTGAPFAIVYTLDTSLGDYAASPPAGNGGGPLESLAKQNFLPPSPISAVLTINGQSFSISGNSIFFSSPGDNPATYSATYNPDLIPFGRDGQADIFDQDVFKLNASGHICVVNCVTLVDNFISTSVTFGLPPAIYQDPFPALSSFSFQSPASGTGTFLFQNLPILGQNHFGDPDVQAAGVFNFETFAISEVQQVPEPAIWTLCLIGIAALGAFEHLGRNSRRRKKLSLGYESLSERD